MDKDWVMEQLSMLQAKEQLYEVDALLNELEQVLKEQYQRIESAEGQLDGTLWSPNQW